MGFISDLVNGAGGLIGDAVNGGGQALGSFFGGGGGPLGSFMGPFGGSPLGPIFGYGQQQPMPVTTNSEPIGQTSGYGPMPSTYVDPNAMPFMPGLGQYTRDPRDAYNKRGNEFPGSPFAPKPADAVHAPYIPDPPKPVWTPWHQAIQTGGWGTGPAGLGMSIPGAPDGTPFMTKTWTTPQTPRPPTAPAPLPAAAQAPASPQMTWNQQPASAAAMPGNANTAWSGGSGSPSWRR